MKENIDGTYTIIDDILPTRVYEELREMIYDNNSMGWYYLENTAYSGKTISHSSKDNSFYHIALAENRGTSFLGDIVRFSYLSIASSLEIRNENLIRARLGMIMPTEKQIVHDPHVDFDFPHYTALLYFSDDDGGNTYIYNELYNKENGTAAEYASNNKENFEVLASIKAKQNRLVLFDGLLYHSSSTPRTERRIAMNLNFTVMGETI